MGQSLFEFANEAKPKTQASKSCEVNEENLKKQFESYSKLSKSQLKGELFKEVEKQKKGGSFNFEEIANKIDSIRPMLSNEQIKNLDNLLNQIK